MRVLLVTHDWKWTGPAEPMLRLAAGLRERGHEVSVACPGAPGGSRRGIAEVAAERGLGPHLVLESARGLRPLADRREVARLRGFLEERDIEVAHCWHSRDHLLVLAAAAQRRRRGATALVRSWRKAEPPPTRPWDRWLLGRASDGLLCVSPGTAERLSVLRRGRPLAGCFGAVDLDRFAPGPAGAAVRGSLGLAPSDRVVGIVARVQRQRRFDLLLDAARLLFATLPDAKLLVVGRGTRRRELAEEPARRLGIADRVVFAGYRSADYAEVLRALDLFTFLVPGSDGTCRALLEAAACGIPAVTSRRGALAEIVVDGETGLLVDEAPAALSAAWRSLLEDDERRGSMGRAARARAEACFTDARFAEAALALYAEARGFSR